jgi:hypothetical protein
MSLVLDRDNNHANTRSINRSRNLDRSVAFCRDVTNFWSFLITKNLETCVTVKNYSKHAAFWKIATMNLNEKVLI